MNLLNNPFMKQVKPSEKNPRDLSITNVFQEMNYGIIIPKNHGDLTAGQI